MFDENIQVIRRAICAGCLSQDRKLSPIKDLKKYAFFCYALTFEERDWVCWECKQMVVKLAGFRRQVAAAQRSLANLLSGKPCRIKSLSKLTKVAITDQPNKKEAFAEVEAPDPLYYQLVEEAVQSDDNEPVEYKVPIDNDEAAADDEAAGDEAMGDEALDNSDARGDDLTEVAREAESDDDAMGDEVLVEELVYEDEHNNEASIELTYIDQMNTVANVATRVDDKSSNVSKNPFSKITTIGNSSFSNIATVSAVHLSLDESEIPLPQPKPKIVLNTRSVIKIVPGNTGIQGTRTEDTFVEIENPFTVELMSEDEMIFWRLRKRNMEFFTRCSPLLRCEECMEPFDAQRLYTAHMKGHSKDFGETACEICELKFHDEEELKIHKERHYKLLKCKHCEFQWDSANGMRGHCLAVHGLPIAAWLCDHCGREYAELSKMQRHRMCHLARKCPECGITLRSHVKKHMLRRHKDLPMLTCDKCGLECKGNSGLKAHVKSCRSVADQTYCFECKVQYKSKYAYRAHFMNTLKHAGDKPLRFQCTQCGKGFLDSASLMNHVDSVHERQKKYLCDVCGKGFFSMLSRRKHQHRLHSGRPVRKDHVCSYCGKAFERLRQLEQHTNKHTGERPFKCNCGASFGFGAALRHHIRLKHTLPHSPGDAVSVHTVKKERVGRAVRRDRSESPPPIEELM